MRITEGIIYLARPIAGCHSLVGPATVGTTWLEYTVATDAPDAARTEGTIGSLAGRRLLIPITNIIAVVIPDDAAEASRSPLP